MHLITPLILTRNEAPNIARTLARLRWAGEILVVDSFSDDRTLEILGEFPNVRLVQRPFDSFAAQCNFGLAQARTDWVLSMDADYVLSDELLGELKDFRPEPGIAGYAARFIYCVAGRPLRGSLYPPRTVLYKKEGARYEDIGHGHKVRLPGLVRPLKGPILHDDRKPLGVWLQAQVRYAAREARHLAETPAACLSPQDRLRKKIVLAPPAVLLLTLFGKLLILDGWPGIFYALQRFFAEVLLSLHLAERKLSSRQSE